MRRDSRHVERDGSRRDGAPPEEQEWHTAQVMACVHPAYVGKKPEAYVDLVNGLLPIALAGLLLRKSARRFFGISRLPV